MASVEQMEYAYKCLNELLDIDQRIATLHKERDKDIIAELSHRALEIQRQADRVLFTAVS